MPIDTYIEFQTRDVAEVVALWRATAGSRPAAVLLPVASWKAGPPRGFDLVRPLRAAAHVPLKLSAPWRALAQAHE